MTKEETLKGLRCCSEFECGECPYKIYEDEGRTYILRCTHKLMVDLNEIMNKTGTWSNYSSTVMECSNCKKHVPYHKYQYCPHCGSKNKMEVSE